MRIKEIALFGISTLLMLWASEGILRVFAPSPYQGKVRLKVAHAKKLGIDFDARTKSAKVWELRDEGKDAHPSYFPLAFLTYPFPDRNIFPLSGMSDTLSVLCNESGEFTVFQSDKLGFNNAPWGWKDSDTDVVLLGDSYIHGACVHQNETVAGHLRTLGKNALSLAMSGNTALINYASYLEYARDNTPEHVVWFYTEANDIEMLDVEFKNPTLSKYFDDPKFRQGLAKKTEIVNRAYSDLADQKMEKKKTFFHKLYYFLNLSHMRSTFYRVTGQKRVVSEAIVSTPTENKKQWAKNTDLHIEILEKIQAEIKSYGGKFLFVYLPVGGRFSNKNYENEFVKKEDFLSRIKEKGIETFDVTELVLAESSWKNFYPLGYDGSHFNSYGYKKIAKAVQNWIQGTKTKN